jgi:hypothetical protein
MLDYGHRLEFGYFLVPDPGDLTGFLESRRRTWTGSRCSA